MEIDETITIQYEGEHSGWVEITSDGDIVGSGGYSIASGPGLNRWFDIVDSEEELEAFLLRCHEYGMKYRSIKSELIFDVEERREP